MFYNGAMEIDVKKIKGLDEGFDVLDSNEDDAVYITEDGNVKYVMLTSEEYDSLVEKMPSASIRVLNPMGDITYDEYEEIKRQVLEALDKTFKPKPEKLNQMKNGCFIVFEGPDGSGKTTICDIVCQKLTDMGFDIVHTREPGGIEIAEKIRKIILDPENTAMDAKTEALLYAASRRQHLVEKVIPSLKENKIVICERFVYSSIAYQGKARGIGYDGIMAINDFAIDGCKPDITIYLDVDEKTGHARINQRSSKDRLDAESDNFHHLVNEGYKEILELYKDNIKVVDATNSIDKVSKDCLDVILDYING